jgi:diaminohydroxyphosphoribosylaminopyrimidine deaminase/5-amino-6-(5-phosphoribosylamino)uracil reductase
MIERSPVRILLDARLRVPLSTTLVATARETPTWIFGAPAASAMAEEILRAKGVAVCRVSATEGRLDLPQVLKILAERGITRLLVEGGPTVAASFLTADLVDEAVLFRSPNAIGPGGINALEGLPLEALTGSPRLTLQGTETIGPDKVEFFTRV